MKYNQTTPKIAEANNAYISQRWKQLSELSLAWYSEAIKYLFLINSGAAATVLAFIGAVAGVRDKQWVWAMLICFTCGIILVGLLQISRVLRIDRLFKNWRHSTMEYYESKLDWEKMIEDDDRLSYSFNWSYIWGYGAFGFFVVGVLIGALNFNSLAKGENRGRQQQTQQTINPSATSPITTQQAVARKRMEGFHPERQTVSGVGSTPSPSGEKEISPSPRKDPP